MPEDKILTALATLTQRVEELSTRVGAHEKKLSYITSLALVVIGVVGGPNALQLITSGGASG
jgi:hypothetical protein